MSSETELKMIAGKIAEAWEESEDRFTWETEVECLESDMVRVSFSMALGPASTVFCTLRDGEFELNARNFGQGDALEDGMFGEIHPGLVAEAERKGADALDDARGL